MVGGLSVVLFASKPLTEQEKLILRNVAALARGEDDDKEKFVLISTEEDCAITKKDGSVRFGIWYECAPSEDGTNVCVDACLTPH